ncbi:MAG TPA: PilZ domain-containing protein [Gammaproteobacteria bacterium]|nr:PilZ domain-containing protein [Gammaproteobacteria bacterium]
MAGLRNGVRRFQRVITTPDAPVLAEVAMLGSQPLPVGDISEGGMELQYSGPELVYVDAMLAVVVKLPPKTVVRANVSVRHLDPTRIGVAFIDLPPAGCQAIRLYMYRNAAKRSLWNRLRQLWQG